MRSQLVCKYDASPAVVSQIINFTPAKFTPALQPVLQPQQLFVRSLRRVRCWRVAMVRAACAGAGYLAEPGDRRLTQLAHLVQRDKPCGAAAACGAA